MSRKTLRFRDGETMGELRLHYATLGKPVRDAAGRVTNAVMLLHGTGGAVRAELYLAELLAGK
jgi:homoserine O-acetyltransferase/O-succinyltransferase